MIKADYCLLDGIDEHFCRRCDSCYCEFIYEHGHEPTDAEIEEEIDRQMAKAEGYGQ